MLSNCSVAFDAGCEVALDLGCPSLSLRYASLLHFSSEYCRFLRTLKTNAHYNILNWWSGAAATRRTVAVLADVLVSGVFPQISIVLTS